MLTEIVLSSGQTYRMDWGKLWQHGIPKESARIYVFAICKRQCYRHYHRLWRTSTCACHVERDIQAILMHKEPKHLQPVVQRHSSESGIGAFSEFQHSSKGIGAYALLLKLHAHVSIIPLCALPASQLRTCWLALLQRWLLGTLG